MASSYTITVAPNDGSTSTTTITVDTSDGQVRITDVHLHAPAGLTATQLPSIDISLLMRAVTSEPALVQAPTLAAQALNDQSTQANAIAGPAAVDATTTTADSDTIRSTADQPAPASVTAEDAAAPKRARRRRVGEEPALAPPAPPTARIARRSHRDSAPAKATTVRKTRTAKKQPPVAGKERAYRRMPDDFATVAARLNRASAIAEHYTVPNHTAQGWLRRLRAAASGT